MRVAFRLRLLFDNLVVTPQFVCFGQCKTGRDEGVVRVRPVSDGTVGQAFCLAFHPRRRLVRALVLCRWAVR